MRKPVQHALLYASFMFTCLEDRAWSLAISLCMQLLGGMQLISIEQFIEGVAQMAFSGPVGRIVDQRSERSYGVILCMLGNNISILLSTGLFAFCLSIDPTQWIYTVCLVAGMIACSSHRVFVTSERNVLARDWMLVLVKGEEEKILARTNALLTMLDQFVNVVSPLAFGALLTFVTLRTSCLVLMACSFISFTSKCVLLYVLYTNNDRLHVKDDEARMNVYAPERNRKSCIASTFSSLHTYFIQPILPAAFGIALLYMTVLSFDGLAIGYGESAGLPENILGFIMSFSSAAGVVGAIMYAVFERNFGVLKTGVIGLLCQEACLLLAVASIWMPGTQFDPSAYFNTLTWSSWLNTFIESFAPSANVHTPKAAHNQSVVDWSTLTTSEGNSLMSILAFLIGVATSRFGLWMADLAITHIIQINTAESLRNTVFGAQNAVCQTFSVAKNILVVILPSPHTFGICILVSFGFIVSGLISYCYYLYKENIRIREKRRQRLEAPKEEEMKPLQERRIEF